ncbi:MAG: hypothetical protein WCI92_13560, partial [Bacteroidota bacterium]
SKFRVQSSGFQFQSSRFKVPGSKFRVPVSTFQFPVSGFKVPGSGFKVPVSSFQFPVSKFHRIWGLKSGFWNIINAENHPAYNFIRSNRHPETGVSFLLLECFKCKKAKKNNKYAECMLYV